MIYKACIISESLKNQEVLSWPQVALKETKICPYKESMQTPWLKQWTFNWIEFDGVVLGKVVDFLKENIDEKKEWYTDLQSTKEKIFIFRNKVFYIPCDGIKDDLKKLYREVVDYGVSVGIPEHQMDITPQELLA